MAIYSVILSLFIFLFASIAGAQTAITFSYDFENGVIPGTKSTMAVKPAIGVEANGNHYVIITGSATDCDAIPDASCPGDRNRSVITLTPSHSSMPLLTSTDGQKAWTYEARMRWTSNSPYDFSALELFMDGTQSECYSCINGTGPVVRAPWRTDQFDDWHSLYNNETVTDVFRRTVTDGNWHHYKVEARWSADPSIAYVRFYFDGVQVANITGRSSLLGTDSNRLPNMKIGIYGGGAGAVAHFDDVKLYPTNEGPPGGGGTIPPTNVARYADDTGTGSTCTLAAPCSVSTMLSLHNGGDTLNFGDGTYNIALTSIKSGSTTNPTIIQPTASGSPVAVGTRGQTRATGNAILAYSGTSTDAMYFPSGTQNIIVRNMKIQPTFTGSNFAVRVGDTSSSSVTSNIVLEGNEITCVNASPLAAMRTSGTGATNITMQRNYIHRCGPAVASVSGEDPTSGIVAVRSDIKILDNDIVDVGGPGISAECSNCGTADNDRMEIAGNRVLGNAGRGIVLGDGSNQKVYRNEISGNYREGLTLNANVRLAEIYNNSIHANSQGPATSVRGVTAATNATGSFVNNIVTNHPGNQLTLVSTVGCRTNMVSTATEVEALHCTDMTFSEVATDIWEDPSNATLLSRDFTLKLGSAAIDNGVADVCSDADVQANRCTPARSLTGQIGAAFDQGSREKDIVVPDQVVITLPVDADVNDVSGLGNHGTATSIDFDNTNKVEGTGAALWNAATDRIVVPFSSVQLGRGFTIYLPARSTANDAIQYLAGSSTSSSSYINRLQVLKRADNTLGVGLGGNHNTLLSNITLATDTWYFITLVVNPPSSGTGSYELYLGNQKVGGGTYTGLTAINSTITIGNNGVNQAQGWTGQLDEIWVWNYPRTATEISTFCATHCTEPGSTLDPLDFDNLVIGQVSASIITGNIISGADPAICSPLSNVQVTCNAVAQTETACSVSDNPSRLTLTLSVPCLASDVVELTIAGYDDPWPVTNNIGQQPQTLVMLGAQTTVSGTTIIVDLGSSPGPASCSSLANWRYRENCIERALTGCSYEESPARRVLLTAAASPISTTSNLDLLWYSTDQIVSVTNLFNPATPPPEVPDPTGVNQIGYRFRPVGYSNAVSYRNKQNVIGDVATGGSIGISFAIANESGAALNSMQFTLQCSRQLPGGNYSDMTPVLGGTSTAPYNSIGLRYDPAASDKLAENATIDKLPIALGPGLTDSGIRRYRRQPVSTVSYNLADDEQMIEEHAIQVSHSVPYKTTYVCRLYDAVGQALDNYTGLAGCDQKSTGFGGGEHPCGAPFVVRAPAYRRY